MLLDHDLATIQEARDLARQAKKAQEQLSKFSAKQIDAILVSMVKSIEKNARVLAEMAASETSYGVVEHKVIKNLFASRDVYEYMKDIQTVGILREDKNNRTIEMAVPVGVVMAITPSTNPTSTVIHNAMVAIKGGNAIVIAPHPSAIKCSHYAAQILHDAAIAAGAPTGVIGCLSKTSMQASQELMRSPDVSVIVATGGSAMVRAAYSAGKPAFGVGPGNVPAYIERSANIQQAIKDIITSKTFDNGMICASEQAIICDDVIQTQVMDELKKQGGYIMTEDEAKRVAKLVMKPNGGMTAEMTGRLPQYIAEKAGFSVPAGTRILVAPLAGFGPKYPLSYEKLTTVLGFYVVSDWHKACELSINLLELGGIGHSFSIHSQDDAVIREFLQKPVFRILVNTPSALGGIGYSTGLTPSLTLGCGTWGGSSISENLAPHHLINIKRLAYGVKSVNLAAPTATAAQGSGSDIQADEIAAVVRQVLQQIKVG